MVTMTEPTALGNTVNSVHEEYQKHMRKKKKNKLDPEKEKLKKAIEYLQFEQNEKKKTRNQIRNLKYPLNTEYCKNSIRTTPYKADNQVILRARQLSRVVMELRKTILKQEWDQAAVLLTILCHPGIKLYSNVIIKACFLLLFNHPNSSLKLVKDFIKLTTGYILEEDVDKFLKILFTIRTKVLPKLTSGKYARKNCAYKVATDPMFSSL